MAGPGWRLARGISLGAFAAVGVLLPFAEPAWSARFWSGVLPILPIVLLVSPALWRNVCPLATLSWGGDDPASLEGTPGRRSVDPPPALLPAAVALAVLVLARAVWLEASPVATGGVLAAVAGVAWVRGRGATGKAGFCNRLCPLLPVERLYGQAPLLDVANARCGDCHLCSPRGCMDLDPTAAVPQILGRERHDADWIFTPFGAFATAFPGLIFGFGILPSGISFPSAAGLVGASALLSWTIASIAVRVLDLGWRVGLVSVAATAAALHLWLAIPGVFEVWGLGLDPGPWRAVALVGVGAWWLRALDAPRRRARVRIRPRPTEGVSAPRS